MKQQQNLNKNTKRILILQNFLLNLLVFFLFSTCYVFAQVEGNDREKTDNPDKTLSPYFFVNSKDASLDQLPLKSTSVNINISGMIADVEVIQEYCNTGKSALEAIYLFPASTRAAVYSMTMQVGNRILVAKIKEKEQARKDYENAKNQGKSASLLEQQRPNVFQMNVANIMPGDTIKVTLRYAEMLVPTDGIYEFAYPTVVGPRYSNKPEANANQNDKWVQNPYLHQNEKPTYTFGLSLRLNAGMPIKDIRCGTHETDIKYETPSVAVCRLNDKEKAGGNRDFILQYRLAGTEIESGLLLYEGETENFFLAMVQPPKKPVQKQIPPREYIFIVDVSGSMNGFPLTVSKELIKDLIGRLQPTDRFNVILFAGSSEVLSNKSLEANAENIQKTIQFIENLQGSGGTELLPALEKALKLEKTEGFARSFVIATDGYVDVEKEAFDLIRNNLDKANFFAFGIGSSVNRFIMEGMARVGKGEPFIVTNASDAGASALKFREYIENPVLTQIKVDYTGFNVYDVEPLTIPDVLAQRPVLLFGKWKGSAQGTIKLTGYSGESKYSQQIAVTTYKPEKNNIALKYLWARSKIQLLDDYAAVGNTDKNAVTELGLKYNLLTKYTSFVAIDSMVRNKDGKITAVNQPLPLPQGVSDYAVGESDKDIGYNNSQGGSGVTPVYKSVEAKDEIVTAQTEEKEELIEKPKEIFTIVEEQPEFEGGEAALNKFLAEKINYPAFARENSIQGKVYVRFCVNPDGSVSDIKVVRSVDPDIDAEAIRVVKLSSGKWKPGKQRGKPVKIWYTVPIIFSLGGK